MGRIWACTIAAAIVARAPATAAPMSIEACARAADPPACVAAVTLTLADDPDRPFGTITTVVESGAPSVVERGRARLVAAAHEKTKVSADMAKLDFDRDTPVRKHLRGALASTVAAAIAVAAAAQIADDPFAQDDAKALIAATGGRATIAPLAAVIWTQNFLDWRWRAALVRTRGMKAILRAVIAQPPRDTAMLAQLAMSADFSGYDDEALALAQAVVARKDASEDDKANASALSLIVPLRKHPPEYDRELMNRFLVEFCYSYRSCSDELKLAADAGATEDLKAAGADLLQRARESNVVREKTRGFGVASEAYRLSGDIEAALAAAREGMPFVEAAFRELGIDSTTSPDRRYMKLVVDADDVVAPAIALYRAGARDEALKSGYISGYQRFHHASVAGETADAKWVVDDRVTFEIDTFVDDLIEAKDTNAALRLHDVLRCSGPDFYESYQRDVLERNLAIAAALVGRGTMMNAHLTAAAHAIDAFTADVDSLPSAWSVGSLASDWRRALTIAERVGAKYDEAVAPACSVLADGQVR